MKVFRLEQDKVIRTFLKKNKHSKRELFDLFQNHFLHPDIEVEFTTKVAKNIIAITHEYYLSLSMKKKFHFLRALGKLFDITLSMKIWESNLSRDDASWYWRGYPTYFVTLDYLIEPLEVMRSEMSLVDECRTHPTIVLVEGESEYNFISSMQELSMLMSLDFPIHNYQGKGNVQNLVHYIKEKNRQGVKVLLTFDKDGRSLDFLNTLKRHKCKLDKSFGFSKDFENSFPPQFLKCAIEEYLRIYCDSKDRLNIASIRKLLKEPKSFDKSFEQEFGINLSKAKLGVILGRRMINVIEHDWNEIFNQRSKRYQAEIYKFLRFIMKLR